MRLQTGECPHRRETGQCCKSELTAMKISCVTVSCKVRFATLKKTNLTFVLRSLCNLRKRKQTCKHNEKNRHLHHCDDALFLLRRKRTASVRVTERSESLTSQSCFMTQRARDDRAARQVSKSRSQAAFCFLETWSPRYLWINKLV